MRSIGMDVQVTFAQMAVVDDGSCRYEGRIGVRPEDLRAWAAKLQPNDQVALEATTNSDAIAMLVEPLVAKVAVSSLTPVSGIRLPSPSPACCGKLAAVSFQHRTVTRRFVALDIRHPPPARARRSVPISGCSGRDDEPLGRPTGSSRCGVCPWSPRGYRRGP